MKLALVAARFIISLQREAKAPRFSTFSIASSQILQLVGNKQRLSIVVAAINPVSRTLRESDRSLEHVFNYGHVEEHLFFGMISVFLSALMTRGKRRNWPFRVPRFHDPFPFSFSDITVGGLYVSETGPVAYFYASQCTLSFCNAKIYTNPPQTSEEGFLISSETLAVTGNRPTTYVPRLQN